MTKAITLRLPDDQYELVSRIAARTGQSRNEFFGEIIEQAAPALRKMLALLDQPRETPGQRVGKVLALAAERAFDNPSDLENQDKAPSL